MARWIVFKSLLMLPVLFWVTVPTTAQQTPTTPSPGNHKVSRKTKPKPVSQPEIIEMNVEEVLRNTPAPKSSRPVQMTNDDFASGREPKPVPPTGTTSSPTPPAGVNYPGMIPPPPNFPNQPDSSGAELRYFRSQAKSLLASIQAQQSSIAANEERLRKMQMGTIDGNTNPRYYPLKRGDPRYVYNGYLVETDRDRLEAWIPKQKQSLEDTNNRYFDLLVRARKAGYTEHQLID